MKDAHIRRVSTLFLKAVLVFIGVIAVVLAVALFPESGQGVREYPQFAHWISLAFIALYATIIPFFFALYQTFKLLHYIDTNNAFSELSVIALKRIKYSAIAVSMLYMLCMPLVFILAQLDDAPGAVLIGFGVACSPLIVATFAAVLQKLVESASDLKVENDLTV